MNDVQYMTHGIDQADLALFDNLRLELRRGCLIVAVLAALRTEQYGYTLRKLLAEHGLDVDEGTLYPLLRRLETQGLLVSEWREEAKRNKRFYRLSDDGAADAARSCSPNGAHRSSLNGILRSQHMDMLDTVSAGR